MTESKIEKINKPKTKRFIAIQCWSCFTWNIPKIDKNDKIIYPKKCVNRNCRTTSYMKTKAQVIIEKQERGKTLAQKTIAKYGSYSKIHKPRPKKLLVKNIYAKQ